MKRWLETGVAVCMLLAAWSTDGHAQVLVEQAAVGQAGEGVMAGHVP